MVTSRRQPLNWVDYLAIGFLVTVVVAIIAFCAWASSPLLRFCIFGAPSPGTAPRYTGLLEVEGKTDYRYDGAHPPRYFVLTDGGRVEFHCGIGSRRKVCRVPDRPRADDTYVIGYDAYWGVDYIKYPRDEPVWTGHQVREVRMEQLETPFFAFVVLAVVALACVSGWRQLRALLARS